MKPFSLDRKPVSGRTAQRSRDGLAPAEHHPLSPPDTESISSHVDAYATPPRRPSFAHTDSTYTHSILPTIPATPDLHQESAGARFRRLAGIPTTQSGSREFRGASRPQTRWLLVLMPPAHLATELAVGHRSPGRLSSGLLIPLFPTLFAQLTAIAKEFSLPSTTGLCLYLHIPDVPNAPRITDDAWPLLWGRHLHTDDAALPLGLPVAGRVEFDIDVPNARWFPMWFAHVSRQELVPDLARAIPLSPRALAKETSPDESTRAAKSIPRPLALAPRSEPVIEVQVDSGPSPIPSPSKPSIPKSASKETVDKVRRWSALVTPDPALRVPESTVPKTDEEAVTEEASEHEDLPLNLEDFQWSISSGGPPSPTSSHATSASSRVRSIHLLERVEGSVLLTPTTATSWGPPDHSDIGSELDIGGEWRVRSPDLGERAEGSVLLTPSTATSWGAPLSYPPTPAQWVAMHELVRSPDLGERAEGSVLLTPSTATTWGAPLSYPPTPAQWHALQQHIRSPDLGQRAEGSVLLTPSTATSWGAPLSYPPTPEVWLQAQQRWVASPDVGARAFSPGATDRMSPMRWGTEVETEQEAYARMGLQWRWEFGWPYDPASAGPTGNPGLAAQAIPEADEESVSDYAEGPEVHVTMEEGSVSVVATALDEEEGVEANVFEFSFPHFEPPATGSLNVAPTIEASAALQVQAPIPARMQTQTRSYGAYPFLVLYPATYPHLDLYPTAAAAAKTTATRPALNIATQPVQEDSLAESIASSLRERSASLSSFASTSAPSVADHIPSPADCVPSPVYSFPSRATSISASVHSQADSPATSSPISRLGGRKRGLSVLVPNVSDPSVVAVNPSDVHGRSRAWSRALPPVPPMPRMDSVGARKDSVSEGSVRGGSVRGTSREGSVRGSSREGSVAAIPPRLQQLERRPSIVHDDIEFELLPVPSQKKPTLSSAYPHRYPHNLGMLYPSVRRLGYPVSLENIYPSVPGGSLPATKSLVTQKKASAAGPERSDGSLATHQATIRASVKTKAVVYPVFNLYPAVYPHNLAEIYPAVVRPGNAASTAPRSVPALARPSTISASSAPALAPATRPVLVQHVKMSRGYPFIDLYPAVYPHNLESIYPIVRTQAAKRTVTRPVKPAAQALPSIRVGLSPQYPALDLFPAVYPYNLERIYPTAKTLAPALSDVKTYQAPKPLPARSAVKTQKPAASNLRALGHQMPIARGIQVRLARTYPNMELYAPVYPFNLDIYPTAAWKAVVVPSEAKVELADTVVVAAQVVHSELVDEETTKVTARPRKTHAKLCAEAWHKTHVQLVAEVATEATPVRIRKSHTELQTEVFPDGPPAPTPTSQSPHVTVTPVQRHAPEPESEPEPKPAVAPLRRQRSGTIMARPPPTGPLPPPPPTPALPQGMDLGRSRSMLEARTQMFERAAPARANTVGAPKIVRQKSTSFERTKSLFHTPEEGKVESEGSRTPPRTPRRTVSKLDMSKFNFS
ncbi:hypothetical protein BDV93DRAFT_519625 [Ceratobasidium sp. AG-I]|nr:hypothetical protein BDV93DRAFT_519625 [Ceratobasidium sp. AG-I]